MSDQDDGALQQLLIEVEDEIAERQAMAAYLRKRLRIEEGDGVPSRREPNAAPAGASASTPRRAHSAPGRIRPDEFFGMKIPQAIKHYLGIMKQPQGPKAIMDGVVAGGLLTNSKNFYTTLWTAIKRLDAAGEVVSTPNGWGLTSWYPNRPKGADNKKPKRKRGRPRKVASTNSGQFVLPPGPRLIGTTVPMESQKSAYHAFLAAEMSKGKSMKEAAAAWQRQKTAG